MQQSKEILTFCHLSFAVAVLVIRSRGCSAATETCVVPAFPWMDWSPRRSSSVYAYAVVLCRVHLASEAGALVEEIEISMVAGSFAAECRSNVTTQ
jgi:hypothetical protein